MIHITDKSRCCGCTACASICPKGCIKMIPDPLGFLYPQADPSFCIECGLCEKVCMFHYRYESPFDFSLPLVYAIRHKNEPDLMKSQSGGAFVALSDYILQCEGVIYGAGFDANFRIVHKRAETKNARDELRGSKYVQSDLEGIFSQIRKDLKSGKTVLFSGTPCQTAGLASYIGKKQREHLILVDLVCHGVPSPFIWRDYLKYIENKKQGQIQTVVFRDKSYGWASSVSTFKFTQGAKIKNTTFSYLFSKRIMQRKSCEICPFTNLRRPSDLTIGDFWGWTKKNKEFDDNKGISLLLINTPKGEKIFNAVQPWIYAVKSNTEDCLQPRLQYPARLHPQRNVFENEYMEKGFEYVAKKYGGIGWWHVCSDLKSMVRRMIKNYSK